MDHLDDLLQCPLCHSKGELRRGELIQLLSRHDLPKQLREYLAGIEDPCAEGELAAVGIPHAPAAGQDFGSEVHNWNPQLPIWRRSSKE